MNYLCSIKLVALKMFIHSRLTGKASGYVKYPTSLNDTIVVLSDKDEVSEEQKTRTYLNDTKKEEILNKEISKLIIKLEEKNYTSDYFNNNQHRFTKLYYNSLSYYYDVAKSVLEKKYDDEILETLVGLSIISFLVLEKDIIDKEDILINPIKLINMFEEKSLEDGNQSLIVEMIAIGGEIVEKVSKSSYVKSKQLHRRNTSLKKKKRH